MNEFRKCLYCGRIYKPSSKYQRYCEECESDRMNAFRKARTFKVCRRCRRVFLSINGATLCSMCATLIGDRDEMRDMR